MRIFSSVEEIKAAVGTHVGKSEWLTVDQKRIDEFAETTGDRQWIHIDPERASAGPFGTTIAHGLLTLSLNPALAATAYDFANLRMGVNYGLNRVRFTAPVPAGSRIRGSYDLTEVSDVDGGIQLSITATIELEGGQRPALVAETVVRYYL